MHAKKKLASVVVLSAAFASPLAVAQGTGISPRGSNVGEETTQPGAAHDKQHLNAQRAHSGSGKEKGAAPKGAASDAPGSAPR